MRSQRRTVHLRAWFPRLRLHWKYVEERSYLYRWKTWLGPVVLFSSFFFILKNSCYAHMCFSNNQMERSWQGRTKQNFLKANFGLSTVAAQADFHHPCQLVKVQADWCVRQLERSGLVSLKVFTWCFLVRGSRLLEQLHSFPSSCFQQTVVLYTKLTTENPHSFLMVAQKTFPYPLFKFCIDFLLFCTFPLECIERISIFQFVEISKCRWLFAWRPRLSLEMSACS